MNYEVRVRFINPVQAGDWAYETVLAQAPALTLPVPTNGSAVVV